MDKQKTEKLDFQLQMKLDLKVAVMVSFEINPLQSLELIILCTILPLFYGALILLRMKLAEAIRARCYFIDPYLSVPKTGRGGQAV